MRSRLAAALLLLAIAAPAAEYRKALPGYQFEFPRDHFSHPDFRTEWWYYTGNLRDTGGKRFGYELTFFRHGLDKQEQQSNVWSLDSVWFAHFAVSDISGKRFDYTGRLNRKGAGVAGAEQGRIWNGNWQAVWNGTSMNLRAVAKDFSIDLTLEPQKPAVIHGTNGVSQKSAGEGRGSHYVSLTRIDTRGTLTLRGERVDVTGTSWMDHEFFTNQLDTEQTGWDWFSLQFDDGTELMLYQLRRKDGTTDPYSAATFVDKQGKPRHLRRDEFELKPGRTWTSPNSGGTYPVEWSIRVPALGLEVRVTTPLDHQELAVQHKALPVYWEGAVDVRGTHSGSGYLEMTGYAGAVRMGE